MTFCPGRSFTSAGQHIVELDFSRVTYCRYPIHVEWESTGFYFYSTAVQLYIYFKGPTKSGTCLNPLGRFKASKASKLSKARGDPRPADVRPPRVSNNTTAPIPPRPPLATTMESPNWFKSANSSVSSSPQSAHVDQVGGLGISSLTVDCRSLYTRAP